MPNLLAIAPLQPEQIERAYPLVHDAEPGIDAGGWRTFCDNVLRRRPDPAELNDIVAATDAAGGVQALCLVADRKSAREERLLDVWCFFVAPDADEPAASCAMIDYLAGLGRARSCRAVRFWTSGRDPWAGRLKGGEQWARGLLMPLKAQPRGEVTDRVRQ